VDISYVLALNLSFLTSVFSLPQSYTGQSGGGGGGGSGSGNGAGDEDYEIPPITPPNHPEPPLLHLMEHDSTGYLCHSLQHNGLINPYSYPELMMSNMLAQDGHLVSSQMPSVSSTTRTEPFHGGPRNDRALMFMDSENIYNNAHRLPICEFNNAGFHNNCRILMNTHTHTHTHTHTDKHTQ